MDPHQMIVLDYIKATAANVLPFVHRGMGDYTDHGPKHSERVEKILARIIRMCAGNRNRGTCGVNTTEELLLRMAAWTHDIGCIVSRDEHAKRSSDIIREHLNIELIDKYNTILCQIVYAHSDDGGDRNRLNELAGNRIEIDDDVVRIDYISAIMRLADACDIGMDRAPGIVQKVLRKNMQEDALEYWDGHSHVIGDVSFDDENDRLIVRVSDLERTRVIIDDLQRNLDDSLAILSGYRFPISSIKVEVIAVRDEFDP